MERKKYLKSWRDKNKKYFKEYLKTYKKKEGYYFKLAWRNMKNRCNVKNTKYYKYYGGRGIGYCKDWENFENFKKDMETGWRKGLSLDRIDNDNGYTKENCRWITMADQQRNRRKVFHKDLHKKTK